eukprot:3933622-Rhodomonas_salina.1
MQLFAAVMNMLAQSKSFGLTLLFSCVIVRWVHSKTLLWDLGCVFSICESGNSMREIIGAAVFSSCLPMIYSGHIFEFCIAIGSFGVGSLQLVMLPPRAAMGEGGVLGISEPQARRDYPCMFPPIEFEREYLTPTTPLELPSAYLSNFIYYFGEELNTGIVGQTIRKNVPALAGNRLFQLAP